MWEHFQSRALSEVDAGSINKQARGDRSTKAVRDVSKSKHCEKAWATGREEKVWATGRVKVNFA
eukprot:2954304-Pleurochrysis_carterae.AAC.1